MSPTLAGANSASLHFWQQRIQALRRLAFDTNALIYALEGTATYSDLVAAVLERMQQGEAQGVISVVVELELLVKPTRERSQDALHRVQFLLQGTPNLFIRSLDRAVAWRAAQIRAQTGLSVPDASIIATALEERCDAIVGNDARMASRTSGVPYLFLGDYVRR